MQCAQRVEMCTPVAMHAEDGFIRRHRSGHCLDRRERQQQQQQQQQQWRQQQFANQRWQAVACLRCQRHVLHRYIYIYMCIYIYICYGLLLYSSINKLSSGVRHAHGLRGFDGSMIGEGLGDPSAIKLAAWIRSGRTERRCIQLRHFSSRFDRLRFQGLDLRCL